MRSVLAPVLAIAAVAALTACSSTTTRSSSSTAATDAPTKAPEVLSVDQYLVFLDELESGLAEGEPRKLNSHEEREFDRLARQMRGILTSTESIDGLTEERKARVYNLNQEIWATVVGKEENKVICRREHTVGTHFKRTTCRTVAEIREEQRLTETALQGMYGPQPANIPSNGGVR
ncbi:MAG: hypothetical protein R3323_03480 [Wenzhouxiangellaceae bacterium]|nr:hypothetical protein [Wenzhouxiangellaceae bacterium]